MKIMFYKLFKFNLGSWNPEEVRNYKQINSSRLNAFYSCNNLSSNDPEGRFSYLVENFTGLDRYSKKMIKKKANEEGKAAALNYLEILVDTFELYD